MSQGSSSRRGESSWPLFRSHTPTTSGGSSARDPLSMLDFGAPRPVPVVVDRGPPLRPNALYPHSLSVYISAALCSVRTRRHARARLAVPISEVRAEDILYISLGYIEVLCEERFIATNEEDRLADRQVQGGTR